MTEMPTYAEWARLTTVAWVQNLPDVVCKAHKYGVKAIASPGGVYADPILTGNRTLREEWAKNLLKAVEARFLDGITFDYEQPIAALSDEARWYTELVEITRDVFHAANSGYQVTVCVAWSPDGIDDRDYDYYGLAQASDALYIMDYDTQSWIFGPCIAGANAPIAGTRHGVQRYLDLGISPSKLILGVPWYGYRYPCLPGTASDARFCPIKEVPFRGVNCSDAAGRELPYDSLMKRFQHFNTTPMMRDHSTMSPYFNTLEDGIVYQYHFDDEMSLKLKYAYAHAKRLRGVGPFTFQMVSNPSIWEAFQVFQVPNRLPDLDKS
ncbi:Di-N-acetylchitobiase [Hondaea fermentalgiana]|uniref:Di-N-acetylchitobiase n=1 Tax=Hondaea fermentalgiana TaxID=2315210 RepID=A0A2R5GFF2_9STRA|nr:Di-N-acetylchitobiase [Hondaea fermentalgiana]|eukprot:GBG29617.1 Di-N-acetylchitobiase [Hondaea fermentalgiana]